LQLIPTAQEQKTAFRLPWLQLSFLQI